MRGKECEHLSGRLRTVQIGSTRLITAAAIASYVALLEHGAATATTTQFSATS